MKMIADLDWRFTPVTLFQTLVLVSRMGAPGGENKNGIISNSFAIGNWCRSMAYVCKNGGHLLELTVCWPSVLLNMDLLHAKWIRTPIGSQKTFSHHHTQFLAFETALRGLRERVTDVIESRARFPLPFPVETYIYYYAPLLHNETASKILYVTLRATAENYSVVNNSTTFHEI